MGSGFRDTGRFSKLSYLGMKLPKKFQRLRIYYFIAGVRNLAFSTLSNLGLLPGVRKNFPEVSHIPSIYLGFEIESIFALRGNVTSKEQF